ncbi:hypothetical protein PybrP1_009377 [[Pythium] brassicae (nom. inval.)]|nr:hypothetical protein PybrP1_009377 [[Pythium] brassicae (nom. inval.)]
MARKKNSSGGAKQKANGAGGASEVVAVPAAAAVVREPQVAEKATSGSCASGCCGGGDDDAQAEVAPAVVAAAEQEAQESACCGADTGGCCSSTAAPATVTPLHVASAAPAAEDACCKSATPATEVSGASCCAPKTKAQAAPAASKGCSRSANGSSEAPGDACCAPKPAAATGCGSAGAKASCCAPKPAAAAVASTGCTGSATANGKSKRADGDACCAPKSAAASTGCGAAKTKRNGGGGASCCAPKVVEVASKGCCGVTKMDSGCCAPSSASKVNGALERKPSNSHPDRVRERLFDRAAEFRNERGASMAPAVRKATGGGGQLASRQAATATLRLAIGGMTCSGCCTRIEQYMATRPGVHGVNVSLLTSRGVFEHDPAVISPQAVEDMVASLGFTAGVMPDESLVSIVLHVGSESPERVRGLLLAMNGVVAAAETTDRAADASAAAGASSSLPRAVGHQRAVLVDYDPEATGARTIVRHLSHVLGFQVYASSPRPLAVQNEEAEAAKFRNYLLASFLLALPIVLMEFVLPLVAAGNPADRDLVAGLSIKDAVGMLCATPILFIVAYPIHESAFLALRFGGRVTMDVLISLSSFTAYAFSVATVVLGALGLNPARSETFFEVTALLVTLILVGRYIEKIVKAKASNSVDALLRIQAKTAILLETSTVDEDALLKESYIDVILVERDDLLRVLPGTRIPTDGVVVEGASTVDESMVTGEARKVAKEPGATVIGGTINAHGVLVVRVTHTITESMLARIVSLVDEAQASKCVSQTLADVVASYFTTFIISISLIMFAVWYHLARAGSVDTHGWAPFPFALRFAITILVISCPCAISLAVPTAIMVSTTIGSQFGVLFKGGVAVEALEKVDAVLFDKTGTLTSGKLAVVDAAFAASDEDARQLWSLVAAAETNSEHAIGKALVAHARGQLGAPACAAALTFSSVPGCGVSAQVDGVAVNIGSFKWMQSVLKIPVPAALEAANAAMQQRGCVVVGVAVQHALVAVVALRDTPRPEARFVIEQLKRQKIQPWIVTGDQRETALSIAAQLGIPAVSVIADALPHQKVEKVRLLQSIGKNWNFTWGLVYNALMMPLACGALYPRVAIPPALAGLSELLSSVPVILFSLLLNLWRPPHKSTDNATADAQAFVVVQVADTDERTPLLAQH